MVLNHDICTCTNIYSLFLYKIFVLVKDICTGICTGTNILKILILQKRLNFTAHLGEGKEPSKDFQS